MAEHQPPAPPPPDGDIAAAVASRVDRLRERFPGRYDDAQWDMIARKVEASARRGILLRRFELANHDEPDARFVAARGGVRP